MEPEPVSAPVTVPDPVPFPLVPGTVQPYPDPEEQAREHVPGDADALREAEAFADLR